MHENGISISGFAETNTNWHHKNIKKNLSITTHSFFQNYSLAFSENQFNPPDRSHLQLCTDHWTSRLTGIVKDPRGMSRWTGQQFRLREGKTLTIITAYRTCNQSTMDVNKPSITASYQQKLQFRKDKKKGADPRKEFITDLIKEIQTIEEDSNNLCIVMMDANKSINDRMGAIRKIMSETSLVDTFSQVAGNPEQLSTYTRDKKRIDYTLTSQHVVPYVSRVGYLAFHESNTSDHRGLFVDISEAILDTKVRLTRPTRRHIGSKSKPSIIYRYKQYIHKQFLIHHIYERASEVQRLSKEEPITPELRKKINRLDKQIPEKILAAEMSQVPREHESDWSIAIHHQSLLCKY
jgi:hypothetical protein